MVALVVLLGVGAGAWWSGRDGPGTATDASGPVLVSGGRHACVVDGAGAVRCWGDNRLMQLGAEQPTVWTSGPVLVELPEATTIGAGYGHTCAVLRDGAVSCWGDNDSGQTSVEPESLDAYETVAEYGGPAFRSSPPTVVEGLEPAVAVTGGWSHSCALLSDGTVACWGDNEFGQLGDGSTSSSTRPVAVTGLDDVVKIAASGGSTCALTGGGHVECWGRLHHRPGNDEPATTSKPDRLPDVDVATDVAVGTHRTCLLDETSVVSCWQSDRDGSATDAPDTVEAPADSVAISVGSDHTCVLGGEGVLRCWGSNEAGQLGLADVKEVATPIDVATPAPVSSVVAAFDHTCVALEGVAVQCFGTDGPYPLTADVDGALAKTAVGDLEGATKVVTGNDHTCVLAADGTVSCWGGNNRAQLGAGAGAGGTEPVTAVGVEGATDVGAGIAHTCALVTDGRVRCWGWNGNGEFGPLERSDDLPVEIPGVSGATSLSVGSWRSCAVVAGGAVRCWGADLSDAAASEDITVPVPELGSAVQVSLGTWDACAVQVDGTVACTGVSRAMFGDQLGLYGSARVDVAMPSGAGSAVEVHVSDEHVCARTDEGRVVCWGHNSVGQVPGAPDLSSSIDPPHPPTVVEGIDDAVALSASASSGWTCAVRAGGDATCWGLPGNGPISGLNWSVLEDAEQIPEGTTDVVDVDDASAVAVGFRHACVLGPSGDVRCWGGNDEGQLGVGTVGWGPMVMVDGSTGPPSFDGPPPKVESPTTTEPEWTGGTFEQVLGELSAAGMECGELMDVKVSILLPGQVRSRQNAGELTAAEAEDATRRVMDRFEPDDVAVQYLCGVAGRLPGLGTDWEGPGLRVVRVGTEVAWVMRQGEWRRGGDDPGGELIERLDLVEI